MRPAQVLQRLAQGMSQALADAPGDAHIPPTMRAAMAEFWQRGMGYAGG